MKKIKIQEKRKENTISTQVWNNDLDHAIDQERKQAFRSYIFFSYEFPPLYLTVISVGGRFSCGPVGSDWPVKTKNFIWERKLRL